MLGAGPVLKLLQSLALDFHILVCNFSREILGGRKKYFYRKMYRKRVALAQVMPYCFFSRIRKSEALVYNSYFFQNSRFMEIF